MLTCGLTQEHREGPPRALGGGGQDNCPETPGALESLDSPALPPSFALHRAAPRMTPRLFQAGPLGAGPAHPRSPLWLSRRQVWVLLLVGVNTPALRQTDFRIICFYLNFHVGPICFRNTGLK